VRELREDRKELSFLSSKTQTADAMRSVEGLCDATQSPFLLSHYSSSSSPNIGWVRLAEVHIKSMNNSLPVKTSLGSYQVCREILKMS